MSYSIVNGQPIRLKKDKLFRVECCDCSLVHDYIPTKDVDIYVYRNDFETRKARKK